MVERPLSRRPFFRNVELEGIPKKEYKGLRMYELNPEIQPNVKCTFAISPSEKFVQEGRLCFDRHEGSSKFQDEVVVSVWSRQPPHREARASNDGYFRVEIPVPLAVFVKMCEVALKKLWLLE